MAWAAPTGPNPSAASAAFLLWDIGMKQGDVSLLGVLSYAAPIVATALLVALGLAAPTWMLGLACGLMVLGAVIATRTSA